MARKHSSLLHGRAPAVVLSILGAVTWLVPLPASADATVQVQLIDPQGRPIDGTITLTGPGGTRQCRTTASRCSLVVPAGQWTARAAPVRGSPPPPRTVAVPAAGVLHLALRAGPSTHMAPAGQMAPGTGPVQGPRPPPPVYGGSSGGTVSGAPTRPGGSGVQVHTAPGATLVQPGQVAPGAGPVVRPQPAPGVVVRPGQPAPHAPRVQPTTQPEARNLGHGSRLCAQGQVLDSVGRPVDATIHVSSGGRIIGSLQTTAGRFSVYDLPHGSYALSATSTRGTRGNGALSVGPAVARIVVRVP